MRESQAVLEDLRNPTRELRRAAPDVWQAFGALHSAAVRDGALPARIKELIALAIAVESQCDGCLASHARAAAREGATPAEVAETLGVSLLMGGGPSSVYAPRAWAAYQEFASETETPKDIAS
jgi:AhpD family alkylhydroperoxidase